MPRTRGSPARDSPERMSSSDSDSSDEETLGKRTFDTVFPRLYKKVCFRRPDEKAVRDIIKDTLKPMLLENRYSFAYDMSEAFTKLVKDVRDDKDLPKMHIHAKDVADELFAEVIAEVPIEFAEDVADEMPLIRLDKSKSFKELIQQCYDTTKTKAFEKAVSDTVEHAGAFLQALRVFKENKENENIEEFLVKYSKRLYNRHMQDIEISINF